MSEDVKENYVVGRGCSATVSLPLRTDEINKGYILPLNIEGRREMERYTKCTHQAGSPDLVPASCINL